ncbi:MAG: hypothetical protein LIO71_06700 [Ruminococcus sp.]|nr:hypothetical protein [Ruminococcus sp.]
MSIELDNVLQLKKLCAKIIGDTAIADDIQGSTIAEVINQITENFSGTIPQTLGSLTVTSVEGTSNGTTKITISEPKGKYNEYRYKVSNTEITVKRNDDLSSWIAWNGVDEITATNGYKIYVAEVDDECKALKCGNTTVVSKTSTLEPLIITSVAGANVGTTAVSVSPSLTQGNYYLYSVTDSTTTLPDYDEKITDMNTWKYWDGSNDITANTGQILRIIEVTTNSGDLAKKGGYVTVTSHE